MDYNDDILVNEVLVYGSKKYAYVNNKMLVCAPTHILI